jgi:hypothetical protein
MTVDDMSSAGFDGWEICVMLIPLSVEAIQRHNGIMKTFHIRSHMAR